MTTGESWNDIFKLKNSEVFHLLRKLLKTVMQSSWMMWERIFSFISRFRSSHISRFGICTVMIKKHRGERIVCEDSTIIQNGDLVGELHLDNETILKLIRSEGPDRAALKIARLARKSMLQISRAYEDRSEFSEVSALVGITLLHRGLTHGLGFEHQAMKPDLFQKLTTSYLRMLLSVMHPDGKNRIDRRTELLVPMMLIHTRSSLMKRFSMADKRPLHEEGHAILVSAAVEA
ncbi:polysaccharide deacetylase [Paenibacillus sp. p3-SID867]|uniref:YkoP family protein n=1 Tax=Paenibacillus sp. p3-SID867 TaxID=2916363 RepID=UPI0021A7695C|nr:polysaccharide deacetylase [Paenibacillus sp. p3-SID867]MCT1399033.1 polysaccharide deacetylase [Paenibacillus sp. p3-SID867]